MSPADLFHTALDFMTLYYAKAYAFFNPEVPGDSILPWIPKSVRYTLLALLILNSKSFPFIWHIRVWRTVFWLVFYRVRHPFATQAEVIAGWDELSPIGDNPMTRTATWNSRAIFDDCDYNFHLSNSSYAKNWDSARFKDIMTDYNRLLMEGGRLAIAGTHFHFIKEIPMLSKYHIKSTVICWDTKWIYYMARFTTQPPKGNRRHQAQSADMLAGEDLKKISDLIASRDKEIKEKEKEALAIANATTTTTTLPFGLNFPPSHIITDGPSPVDSGIGSPSSTSSDTDEPGSGAVSPSLTIRIDTSLKSSKSPKYKSFQADNHRGFSAKSPIAAGFAPLPRKMPMLDKTDGSILNCLAISRCCWKYYGRITIPPPLAMACVGFGLDQETWLKVRAMRDAGKIPALLAGGWKDVPVEERWWDKAFEQFEERRVENMKFMQQMQQGMESVML